jgi:hypothetical protein
MTSDTTEPELDIVEELRFFAEACDADGIAVAMLSGRTFTDAATEIERLRSEIGTSVPIDDDSIGDSRDSAGDLSDRAEELISTLRYRACPAGLPHTGDSPKEDHGHTDCWLHHQAADEIQRLLKLTGTMADS